MEALTLRVPTPWTGMRETGLFSSQKILELLTCSWAAQDSFNLSIASFSAGGSDPSLERMD